MKKSKIMALVLVVVLAVTSVIGGTYAYLTDRESNVNVFTVGDVSIRLDEDFEQGATLIPGVDINKDVTITNTGKNDAWVWYTYAIPSALDSEDASENVVHINHAGANWLGYQDNEAYWAEGQTEATPENKCWIVDYNPEGNGAPVGTVELEGITYNVYAVLYNGKLPVGETTTVGLTKVYMDPHVDIDPNGDWYHVENGVAEELNWNTNTDGAPLIYVSAYAIQTEGFATVQDAYAAYNAQWTTTDNVNNGTEYGNVVVASPESGATRPAGYNPVEEETNVVDGITVIDGSDDKTNLRALYTGDGKQVNGDLTVTDCYLDGTYAMNVIGDDTGVLTVTDTDLRGWVSYDGFTAATFTNCTFAQNSNPEYYNNVRPYSTVTFTNCEFDGTTFWLDMLPADAVVTFENCTMNGEPMTEALLNTQIVEAATAGAQVTLSNP